MANPGVMAIVMGCWSGVRIAVPSMPREVGELSCR
jgi:hypothetical protein